jgi:hypothetical protein
VKGVEDLGDRADKNTTYFGYGDGIVADRDEAVGS